VALFLKRFCLVAGFWLAATSAFAQGGIEVQAAAIPSFDLNDRELRQFGKLVYRGGLQLTSPAKEFGGISALHVQPDGSRFLAVTDVGRWMRGRIVYSGATPTGLADVQMSPILGPDGKRLTQRRWYDSEAMTEHAGTVYVGIERVHQIVKFDFAKRGFRAHGEPIPVPESFKSLPGNKGIEGLAVLPKSHPLAGALVVITEAALDAAGNNQAFLLGGPKAGAFSIKRTDDFDVTDCAALPGGDLLILERRFSLLRSAVRIRRIAAADIKPEASIDPPIIFYADFSQQIDNFEGLGVHRTASGETVLTLVSDDNFSPLQRTLLMQFTLLD
jgi:hypothetical protein